MRVMTDARRFAPALLVCLVVFKAHAVEEKIRGVLEKTVKPGACAQITDALAEIYYINKTDEAEKMIADYVGKNIKVVITGTVEQKEGDPAYYFSLKSVEPYNPKMPPAPAPVPAPAANNPPAENKPDENKQAPPPAPSPAPAPAEEKK